MIRGIINLVDLPLLTKACGNENGRMISLPIAPLVSAQHFENVYHVLTAHGDGASCLRVVRLMKMICDSLRELDRERQIERIDLGLVPLDCRENERDERYDGMDEAEEGANLRGRICLGDRLVWYERGANLFFNPRSHPPLFLLLLSPPR